MSHDQLFKELLSTFFDEFLHFVAHDLLPHLDSSGARELSPELFTDFLAGDQRFLDLLMEVPTRRGASPATVFVHTEVERSFSSEMGQRMWDYTSALKARGRRPILPIVLYLHGGPAGVTEQTIHEKLFGTIRGTFRYISFGLSHADPTPFLESDRPLGGALAALMSTPAGWSRAEHRLHCVRSISRTARATKLRRMDTYLLGTCVSTYLPLTHEDKKEYEMLMAKDTNQDVRKLESRWGEDQVLAEWKEARFQELLAQELERKHLEGVKEGMKKLLLRLLERRFGQIPNEVRQKVAALDSERRIQELTEQVADAERLDDLGLA